jgi:inner membrane protein
MLPDVDHRLPVIEHRGITHSLLFAALIAGLFGAVGTALAGAFSVAGMGLGVFGVLLGVLVVGAHLVGDALTPAGVPLLWPLPQHYSLSVTRADNTLANYGLFLLGIAVTGVWAVVAVGLG